MGTSNERMVWGSLMDGLEVLKKGALQKVGDGGRIMVWKDPQIPNTSSRMLQGVGVGVGGRDESLRVYALTDHVSGKWKLDPLLGAISSEEHRQINSIPLLEGLPEDKSIWPHEGQELFQLDQLILLFEKKGILWLLKDFQLLTRQIRKYGIVLGK